MALHILTKHFEGKRIFVPPSRSTFRFRGVYTNNPHFLVRFDVDDTLDCQSVGASRGEEGREALFSLVVSAYEKIRPISFTLQVFCTAPFQFYHSPSRPTHQTKVTGKWVWEENTNLPNFSAGGSCSEPTYFRNPQFTFLLTEPSPIHCELLVPKDKACHLKIFRTSSSDTYMPRERVHASSSRNEALSCDVYRHGFTSLSSERSLDTGSYVIIPSLFDSFVAAPFVLSVYTSRTIELVQL